MKTFFGFVFLLLIAAIASAQDPVPCDNQGTEDKGGEWLDGGFVACDNGIVSWGIPPFQITWEDPVCPLMLTWVPPYHNVVSKNGSYVVASTTAKALAVFFKCEDDQCVKDSELELPGEYQSYVTKGCLTQPPQ